MMLDTNLGGSCRMNFLGGTGMRTRLMTGAATILMAAAGLAAAPATPHITPTVVLRKQADVIRTSLPEATQFFVKSVTIGHADFRQLSQAGFTPESEAVDFYYGTGQDGSVVGVVLFPQVNTAQHGPMEIGLTMSPDGTVRRVVVTKATVETKPWVQAVEGTGVVARFAGLGQDGDPRTALQSVSRDAIGDMPYYVAGLIVRDVQQGLALYRTLYRP